MFDHAVPRLQTAGVRKFLLEVMQANEPAIKAYERTGFEITREFDCFLLSTENPPRTLEEGREFEIRPAERTLLKGFVGDFEWTPSWENSPEAVTLVPEDLVAYGAFEEKECLGMVIYYPLLRWIMSLIVKPGHRRKGVGSALVGHLLRETGDLPPAIKLNNVDRSDTGMRAFLELLGFELYASQFEMMRGL